MKYYMDHTLEIVLPHDYDNALLKLAWHAELCWSLHKLRNVGYYGVVDHQ